MHQGSTNLYEKTFYPESTFGGFTDVDGTVTFYARVNALIEPSFVVVDYGCGRGVHSEDRMAFRRKLRCLRGKVSKVIGIDVDAVGAENSTVDEFRQVAVESPWPLRDKSCNLVICDWVMEHLPDPQAFFGEAKRVLVRGGYLCIRTANALSYVGIISRLVPNKYHNSVLSVAQSNRREEDVFPTLYRCNTISALRRQMVTHGLRAVVYGYEAEPYYLNFSKMAYGVGVLHQKLAPGFVRPALFAFGQSL